MQELAGKYNSPASSPQRPDAEIFRSIERIGEVSSHPADRRGGAGRTIARAIISPRREGEFVSINCGALRVLLGRALRPRAGRSRGGPERGS
jgi:hypothetical protein